MYELLNSVRARWLGAALIAGLFLLVLWQTSSWTRQIALERLQAQALNELNLQVASLQGKLAKYEYLPQLLATREELALLLQQPEASPRQAALNRRLEQYQRITNVADIYLLDQDGTTVAASNWQLPRSFIGQNFAFRPYFQAAMAGRPGRFYGLGTTSQARGYYFSYPVRAADRILGAIVVKLDLHNIETPRDSGDSELIVTDPDGVIFISSRAEWRLRTLTPLPPATRERLKASLRYAGRDLRPIAYRAERPFSATGGQGLLVRIGSEDLKHTPLVERYLQVSQPLPEFGWQLHVLRTLTPVRIEVYQTTLLAGVLFAVVVLLLLIWLQRLRTKWERRRYEQAAQEALQRAYDELEHRVQLRTSDLTKANQRLTEEMEHHRRTAQTLRQTQDELVQAAKLAVLGQLSASINHELNQPLAAIRAYADNARAFLERQRLEPVRYNLEQILELTERMTEISGQLKTFARKSSGQLAPVSLQAVLRYALKLYKAKLKETGVRLVRQVPEQDVYVMADMVRLEQVLVNLIGNALQAMQGVESPQLTLVIEPSADQAVLRVVDNGPGIAEEHLPHIFAPFFTTKESGQGLGLSISHRIIQDLGGSLQAANRPAGGAELVVTLPRVEPEAQADAAGTADAS